MIFLQRVKTLLGKTVFLAVVLAAAVGLVVSVEWFSTATANMLPKETPQPVAASLQSAVVESEPLLETPSASEPAVPALEINASAAISIVKPFDEPLFKKNADKQLPIASLTKLMTALVVLEHYNLDQQVIISEAAMEQEGEQGVLEAGQTLTVRNLLYSMLMESSNRAAYALADAMGDDQFVQLMNENAATLGLGNTYFADSTGLGQASYSSARDIAALSYYLFNNYPFFAQIIGTPEKAILFANGMPHHVAQSTNSLLGQEGVVGGKTGYTVAAQGCFMVIQQAAGGAVKIHVILGAASREEEIKKLLAN